MITSQTIKITAFALATVIIIFALGELGLRIVGVSPKVDNPFFMLVRVYEYPDYFKKDHNLFWRLRKNIKEGTEFLVPGSYRTNSLGLRGGGVSRDEKGGQISVACFGNSCTFGWRLEENQTYEGQLQTLLHQSTRPFGRVLNCGVPGYSSFQGLRMMKEYLPILRPKYVTICYGWNDHWAAGFDIEDKDQKSPPQLILDMQNLLSESYLYRTVKYLMLSKYEKKKEYTYNKQSPKYRVSLDDYSTNLKEAVSYIRSMGAIPLFITSPAGDADPGVESPMERYHQSYNEVVRSLSVELSVPLVDAATVFRDHPEFYDDPKADFIHYNAQGAAWIATELANVIQSNNN